MSVEGDFDPESLSRAREQVKSGSIKARSRALYKFTRPHTIRGTILGSIAGTVRVLIDTPGSLTHVNWNIMLPRALLGMASLLLGNAYIVGINQIYDESIDKLNKPFLPVASGEMSKRFAWIAVVLSGAVGPVIVSQLSNTAVSTVLRWVGVGNPVFGTTHSHQTQPGVGGSDDCDSTRLFAQLWSVLCC
jgi:4-hydroxybenzoate polyprenyltransferase